MSDMKRMLREIEMEVDYTSEMIGKSALDPRVMDAMRRVPRHEFVPETEKRKAYYNGPLSIGHGQTISQPYIVALMTDLLNPEPDDVMLEIGTGSGYQTAVLSLLIRQLYTLEIVEPLAEQAAERLHRLKYNNVECRLADGHKGWPEKAPFDGIIVTAATPVIPQSLLDQLKPGGRLVVPVGEPYSYQELVLLEKSEAGELSSKKILGVSFVPMTGASDMVEDQ